MRLAVVDCSASTAVALAQLFGCYCALCVFSRLYWQPASVVNPMRWNQGELRQRNRGIIKEGAPVRGVYARGAPCP